MRRLTLVWAALAVALLPHGADVRVQAQAGGAGVLVIEGGTLIDGRGGPPVRDVQIVVEGTRIRAIGRKGQAPPAGAQVIEADGRFIVPGVPSTTTTSWPDPPV